MCQGYVLLFGGPMGAPMVTDDRYLRFGHWPGTVWGVKRRQPRMVSLEGLNDGRYTYSHWFRVFSLWAIARIKENYIWSSLRRDNFSPKPLDSILRPPNKKPAKAGRRKRKLRVLTITPAREAQTRKNFGKYILVAFADWAYTFFEEKMLFAFPLFT